MVVVEDERLLVIGIDRTADAPVAGTQVAITEIFRQGFFVVRDGLADPRAVLPVRRDDHPFFAQRMPSFFPDHWLAS